MDEIITVIKGTELKLRLEVDLGDYVFMDINGDFKITAYTTGKTKITLTKEGCIPISDSSGNIDESACFVPIDTALLDPGVLILDISIDIPDDDYTDINDGYRTEIYRKKTNIKIIV